MRLMRNVLYKVVVSDTTQYLEGWRWCTTLCKFREEGGGVLDITHGRSRMMTVDPSHPYSAATEHVGFSPIRQGVFGKAE